MLCGFLIKYFTYSGIALNLKLYFWSRNITRFNLIQCFFFNSVKDTLDEKKNNKYFVILIHSLQY